MPDDDSTTVKISTVIEKQLDRRLEAVMVALDESKKAVVTAAIEEWLERHDATPKAERTDSLPSGITPEERVWLKKLVHMLRKGVKAKSPEQFVLDWLERF